MAKGESVNMAERVAILEAILPRVESALKDLGDKTDRVLERLESNLDKKADRAEVEVISKQVDEVRKKVYVWSGMGAVLAAIAGWFGKDLFH